jgi:hypothetical protein
LNQKDAVILFSDVVLPENQNKPNFNDNYPDEPLQVNVHFVNPAFKKLLEVELISGKQSI